MLSITSNYSSLILQNSMKMSANRLNQVIERMSTGYKINHAKDDVANYGIATNMTTKINSYQVAEDNCEMGLDMVTTAEASLSLIQDKLLRLRELQGQASNDTYSDESLKAINSEATAIVDELHRVYESAQYNGIKLFAEDKVDNSGTPTTLSTATAQTRATVAVDESKRVSNVTSFTSGETYYLTTADDLVALQNLVKNSSSTKEVTFEQAADIDMSGVEFEGIESFGGDYNGNEHKISNLKIDNENGDSIGLFCYLSGSVQGIILKNCDISGSHCVGGIAGYTDNATITNCSVSGTVSGQYQIGGLVGRNMFDNTIENCTVDAEVSGYNHIGGLCGFAVFESDVKIDYVSVTGTVTGNSNVGGLIGWAGDVYLSDSSVACKVNGTDASVTGVIYGTTISDLECTFTNVTYDGTLNPGMPLIGRNDDGSDTSGCIDAPIIVPTPDPDPTPEPDPTPDPEPTPDPDPTPDPEPSAPDSIMLQIGIGSDEDSQLAINTKFDLTGLEDLCDIGLDTTTDFLTKIDSMLETVSAKRTELGAVSNRLESALSSIAVSYNNLVSSRSTIQDADIAELSSEYIHQQILQQASATLMASANQSPSVALQLLYSKPSSGYGTLRYAR